VRTLRRADAFRSATKATRITKLTKPFVFVFLVGLVAERVAVGSLGQPPQDLPGLAKARLAQIDGEIKVTGLKAPVTVVRDTWGVPHISAQSADDLFFAQGYVMAQDRLWQMEMWRRAAEGRMAEIAGPSAVNRDRVARLLKYRGPSDDTEWKSYHPDAKRIFTAYVNGVNAFIAQHRDRLPIEFVVTGIVPEPWTIEQIVLRPPSFGDAVNELQLARNVARVGAEEANRARNPDPPDPLRVPDGLDVAAISDEAIAAARMPGGQTLPSLLPPYRAAAAAGDDDTSVREPGSNNWVVGKSRSATGHPVVANDPHREVTNPSLRYIVHLRAPGWNVAGAGEPPFVGVAIGHNERLAWGLTIVGTDQEDVYVETLNPANANEVRVNGAWEPLKIVKETILVKGAEPATVELKFSRHGPIFYEDKQRNLAFAVRRAAAEPGTAPYLAGLRLSQARNCREFLDAAMHWKAPTENLICGDVDDNISWRPAALTPARNGWNGRLPVSGGGQYEWRGFRKDLPSELNPDRGYIATANHNINPPGYTPPLMFKNADTRFERITRLRQMLDGPPAKLTIADHKRMQHDALSLRALADLPAFRGWTAQSGDAERLRAVIAAWDGVYSRDSRGAAVYERWRSFMAGLASPANGRGRGRGGAGGASVATRTAAEDGLAGLAQVEFEWVIPPWGFYHGRAFPHPLLRAFDLGPVQRSGGAGTVEADGASYREIFDVADWDRSLIINVPGQSGQPGSPFYDNLLQLWADNGYFPLVFSPRAIDKAAKYRLTLKPSA
jgi:penicillin G amidase